MKNRPHWAGRRRSAFSLIELVIVMMIAGIVTSMAIPRVNTGSYRADAAVQQVRSVFTTAQRTSLTRQFDVIVSVDTVKSELRIAEDKDNNGVIIASETRFWRPPGDGNRFTVPPVGLNTPTVNKAVVGGNIRVVDNMPSVFFHRDGSASTDLEVYISSTWKTRTDYRVVALTRSTGRAEAFRLSGTGATAKWEVAQ